MSASTEIVNQDKVLEQLNQRLGELKAASEITITDQDSLIRSGGVKLDLEGYIRSVEHHFEPELAPLEERVKRLKLDMTKLLAPAKQFLKGLVDRQREWSAEEKRRTELERQREQEKINAAARAKAEEERREADRLAEERRKEQFAEAERERREREKELEAQRKAGEINKREMEKAKKAEADRQQQLAKQREQEEAAAKALAAKQAEETIRNAPTVKVAANIPKVEGIKNQTFYYGDVTNGAKILFAYDEAIRKGDNDRAAFLSRFVMVDEKEVGKFARDTKDNLKASSLLPGVNFYSKG